MKRFYRVVFAEAGPVKLAALIRDDAIRLYRRIRCTELRPYRRIRYLTEAVGDAETAWMRAADTVSRLKAGALAPADIYTVVQGQITVNTIDVIYDTGDILIIEADCHSKYPEIALYGGNSVWLAAGQHSLHCDRDAEMTRVDLPGRCSDWSVQAEPARYTVRIVAWKDTAQTEVWRREDWKKEGGEG